MREPEGFRDFVAGRSAALVRSAFLLTGNQATAEDLVQTALAATWSRWPRVVRQDAPEAYVRRVMVSTYLSWSRRRWRGEQPTESLPESVDPDDRYALTDLRLGLAGGLVLLPPRQRAVIILRYFDDLTESQVADALKCSVGTVKSQTAKAFEALRRHPGLQGLLIEEADREPR